jgi:mannose-6-phosphate isomerase-like protein (cupin superfamily)
MSADDALVRPGGGETIAAQERREVVILAERPDLTITWSRYRPGERGPDLHVHREHVDAFYVLEGELTFAVGPGGAERVRVPAGGFVAVPPDVVHTFANENGAEARWLNLHAPDKGFAAYLRGDGAFDIFDPPADGGLPPAAAIVAAPADGERLVSGNRVLWLKAVLPQLSFAEWVLDGPIRGPHLHSHDDQVDAFYVLEGELEMTVEDSIVAVGEGTLASVPRGVRHTFTHRHARRARFLNMHAPDAGFAEFLRGVSD